MKVCWKKKSEELSAADFLGRLHIHEDALTEELSATGLLGSLQVPFKLIVHKDAHVDLSMV